MGGRSRGCTCSRRAPSLSPRRRGSAASSGTTAAAPRAASSRPRSRDFLLDHREHGAHLHLVALHRQDLAQRAVHGRLDLLGHLVGLDLQDRLPCRDRLALLLAPAGDGRELEIRGQRRQAELHGLGDTTAVVKDAATVRARLLHMSSTALVVALGRRGAITSSIRRLTGEHLAGPAVTAACGEQSVAGMFRALQTAGEGDVLCVAGGGGECAYLGDLAGAEAVRRRLAGVVVDGLVRDVDGLARLGLTVFARGPGAAGVPVEIGGQPVRPGDWVVGDADGLVVVPAEDAEAALALAEAAAAADEEMQARIAAGASLFDLDYRG